MKSRNKPEAPTGVVLASRRHSPDTSRSQHGTRFFAQGGTVGVSRVGIFGETPAKHYRPADLSQAEEVEEKEKENYRDFAVKNLFLLNSAARLSV